MRNACVWVCGCVGGCVWVDTYPVKSNWIEFEFDPTEQMAKSLNTPLTPTLVVLRRTDRQRVSITFGPAATTENIIISWNHSRRLIIELNALHGGGWRVKSVECRVEEWRVVPAIRLKVEKVIKNAAKRLHANLLVPARCLCYILTYSPPHHLSPTVRANKIGTKVENVKIIYMESKINVLNIYTNIKRLFTRL